MENQQQQPQTTQSCRGGCGFYGSPATEGLCSKCFKDSIKRKQDTTNGGTVSRIGASASAQPTIGGVDASTSSSSSASQVVAAALAAASSSSTEMMMMQEQQPAVIPVDVPMEVTSIVAAENGGTGANAVLNMVVQGIVNGANPSQASLSSSCSANSLEDGTTAAVARPLGMEQLASQSLPTAGISPIATAAAAGVQVKKVAANRCHVCKKRVGLTGFVCRCGGLYCGEHRYDQAHECTFDYKTMEREEIRKNNPVVVSDKIRRI